VGIHLLLERHDLALASVQEGIIGGRARGSGLVAGEALGQEGRQEFWDQVRPWESNRLSKFYGRKRTP